MIGSGFETGTAKAKVQTDPPGYEDQHLEVRLISTTNIFSEDLAKPTLPTMTRAIDQIVGHHCNLFEDAFEGSRMPNA